MYNINSLYIEITSKCNLDCKHCFNNSGNGDELDYCDLEKNLFDAVEMNIPSIVISGGEPLTHSKFKDICLLIKSKGFELLINTNGVLIDGEMVHFLYENEIYLQISLEGATAYSNDFIRGNGVFEKVCSALQSFPSNYLSKYVHLQMTLTQLNKNEIEAYIKLANHFGIKYVGMSRLRAEGRAISKIGKEIYLTEHELMEMVSLIKNLKGNIKIGYSDITEVGACFITTKSENKNFTPRITRDGYVYSCQMFDDLEIALGNVFQTKLCEILDKNTIDSNTEKINLSILPLKECDLCGFKLMYCKGCLCNGLFCNEYLFNENIWYVHGAAINVKDKIILV